MEKLYKNFVHSGSRFRCPHRPIANPDSTNKIATSPLWLALLPVAAKVLSVTSPIEPSVVELWEPDVVVVESEIVVVLKAI